MAINSIDNKYYTTLSDYTNSTKTNAAASAADVKNTAKPGAIPDEYEAANQAQMGFDNSGFLNYGPSGTYTMPSLANFLSTGSSDNAIDLSDGQNPSTATDPAADAFSYTDGNDAASQIVNVFNSIADGVDEENSRLINNAIAKINGTTGK